VEETNLYILGCDGVRLGLQMEGIPASTKHSICFLELGKNVVVLQLFCMQPSYNVLGMVQDTQLAYNILRTMFLRWEFQYFSITFSTGFLVVRFKVILERSEDVKKRSSNLKVFFLPG
jgi:hypothetical protein